MEVTRRDYGEPLPGDPFLDQVPRWATYRSAGQREGIRSLLTAPPGATLVLNLPTGSGKSLCAHLLSLVRPATLTVVVVPTTALAIDQERVLADYIHHSTAYYGGSHREARERNQGIRERIREGTQQIVFTSPESLLQSLAGSIHAAARRGFLRLLAVDEAHIIDQWGDEFRSEFQELAGFRRDLLRACEGEMFRTLLLTGTMTVGCLDTLETLFGRPGPFAVVSSVQLRPEPSYWVAACDDEGIRRLRVLESLRHLPRPLLLYVSKIDHAYAWEAELNQAGYHRVAVVTGRTPDRERSEVVQRWQANELDVIVANSAFGLGMDKSDVRAVIHACVPENIDRFYQEVGRGGRDGNAAVSLILHTPHDRFVAARLNRRTVISTRKGFGRWKRMFHDPVELRGNQCRVQVDLVPSYGYGVFENNSYNLGWNVLTLTLMSRAGVIELDAQPPPRPSSEETADWADAEERYLKELERHRNERVVRILDDGHLDFEKTWRTKVENGRARSDQTTREGLRFMYEALDSDRCFAEIFSEAYTVPSRIGASLRQGVVPSPSCGGCPKCRREGAPPYTGGLPSPLPVWPASQFTLDEELRRFMGTAPALVLFDDDLLEASGSEWQRRERLLRWLVVKGVQTIVASDGDLGKVRPIVLGVPDTFLFFAKTWEPLQLPRGPTLVIRPDARVLSRRLHAAERDGGTYILWMPDNVRDPEKPHCFLRDTIRYPHYRFEEFCSRLGL